MLEGRTHGANGLHAARESSRSTKMVSHVSRAVPPGAIRDVGLTQHSSAELVREDGDVEEAPMVGTMSLARRPGRGARSPATRTRARARTPQRSPAVALESGACFSSAMRRAWTSQRPRVPTAVPPMAASLASILAFSEMERSATGVGVAAVAHRGDAAPQPRRSELREALESSLSSTIRRVHERLGPFDVATPP